MNYMYCQKCGASLTSNYCSICGAFNNQDQPQETTQSQDNSSYTPQQNNVNEQQYQQNNTTQQQYTQPPQYNTNSAYTPNQNACYQNYTYNNTNVYTSEYSSPKSRLVTLLLALIIGVFGIHRFYVGKVGTGILYLFTGGLFGIGYIVDIILIVCGQFRDSDLRLVLNW